MPTEFSSKAEWAIHYAELGFRIFPCRPNEKIPLTRHGFKDATSDTDKVRKIWERNPAANIAISTHNLLVVDIDPKEGFTWPGDSDKHESLNVAAIQSTPRGGCHYIFFRPDDVIWKSSVKEISPIVDIRTGGAYILAAPSQTKDGKYAWIEGSELRNFIPPPPDWLCYLLDHLQYKKKPKANGHHFVVKEHPIPEGQRDVALTSIAGTMRRIGMGKDEIFSALIQTNNLRCKPPLSINQVEKIATSVCRYDPDPMDTAIVENQFEEGIEEIEKAFKRPIGDITEDPGPFKKEWLYVPGFCGELMDYSMETAPYPNQPLAFCAAIACMAFLAGRKIRDSWDVRTNLYILGLAHSGAGKDHPRKVNANLLFQAGYKACVADRFASGEGIQDRLISNNAMLYQTDEIDGILQTINKSQDARHEGIMSVLLTLYSSSNSVYPIRVRANQSDSITIDQPHLVLFGTAIPNHYYSALSERMLTNGFFARMFIIEGNDRQTGARAKILDIPQNLIDEAKAWREIDFNSFMSFGNLGSLFPRLKTIPEDEKATQILMAFKDEADNYYQEAANKNDSISTTVWARAHEMARKLALIYAASESRISSKISVPGANWAVDFVRHQTRRMLFMASEHSYDSEFDKRCKKLLSFLRETHSWTPFYQIMRKLRWPKKDHVEIRNTLLDRNVILYRETKSKNSGRSSGEYRILFPSEVSRLGKSSNLKEEKEND